jgi:hypothetical protein
LIFGGKDCRRFQVGPREGCPETTIGKGAEMVYSEPETARFLAAVQRLKRQQRRKEKMTREAKQKLRSVLRKLRAC